MKDYNLARLLSYGKKFLWLYVVEKVDGEEVGSTENDRGRRDADDRDNDGIAVGIKRKNDKTGSCPLLSSCFRCVHHPILLISTQP